MINNYALNWQICFLFMEIQKSTLSSHSSLVRIRKARMTPARPQKNLTILFKRKPYERFFLFSIKKLSNPAHHVSRSTQVKFSKLYTQLFYHFLSLSAEVEYTVRKSKNDYIPQFLNTFRWNIFKRRINVSFKDLGICKNEIEWDTLLIGN